MCFRWVRSPSLSFVGATVEQERIGAEAVGHLNEALAETPIRITLLKDKNADANIVVHFGPLGTLSALARKHDVPYVEGKRGFAWFFPNAQYRNRTRYYPSGFRQRWGGWLRSLVLHEIMHALGLRKHSPVFLDSIMYEKGNDGGYARQLSELDKRSLSLIYNHVRSGANEGELRAAYDKHWPKD